MTESSSPAGPGAPVGPGAYPGPGGYAGPPPPNRFDGPWGPLAPWGTRVLASLIDSAVSLIGLVPYVVGLILFVVGAPSKSYDSSYDGYRPEDAGNTALMIAGGVLVGVGVVLMFAIAIWNRCFKQGRTGQSIGKRGMAIRLVDEHSGRPIGAGMAFVRELAHYLDGAVYIGYLWPLWDDKRQTFADKILNTVVVEVPKTP